MYFQVSLQGNDPLALQYRCIADSSGGNATDIYVLDTGLRTTYNEFKGWATFLQSSEPGVPGEDVNGRELNTLASGTRSVLSSYRQPYRWDTRFCHSGG